MDENELNAILERYATRTDDYAVLVRRLVSELRCARAYGDRMYRESNGLFVKLNEARAKIKTTFEKLLGEV